MSDTVETKHDENMTESEAKVEYLVKKVPETVKVKATVPKLPPASDLVAESNVRSFEFRFDVTSDNKDSTSKESILIRRNSDGAIIAIVDDPDANKWSKGTSWSLWPQPFHASASFSIPMN